MTAHYSYSLPVSYLSRQSQAKHVRRWDAFAVSLVYIALLGCFILPINQGMAGLVLSAAAAFIAPRSARTWVLFIVASQIVPDPKVSPLTVAQLGVGGWLIAKSWRLPVTSISLIGRFLRLFAPLCVWMGICAAIDRTVPDYAWWLGVVVGAITISHAPAERGFVRAASEGLVIGSSVIVSAYLLALCGFPVVTNIDVFRLSSEIYHRIGFGRGDVNLTATTGAVFAVGAAVWWSAYSRRTVVSTSLAVVALALSAKLIIDTYSRAGLFAYGFGLAVAVVLVRKCRVPLRIPVPAIVTCVLLAAVAIAVAHEVVLNDVSNYWQQIQNRNRQDEIERRTGSEGGILAGRTDVWFTHARLMFEHPITGVRRGDVVDFGEYGVTEVGEEGVWGAAHNDILEMGSRCGIPGAVLLLYCMVWIPIRVLRSKLRRVQIPALAIYLTYLMISMAFSMGGNKSFWASAAVLFASIVPERVPIRFVYLPSSRVATWPTAAPIGFVPLPRRRGGDPTPVG